MGWLAAWFVHALLKGRSVAEVERGFWIVVLVLIGALLTVYLVLSITASLQR